MGTVDSASDRPAGWPGFRTFHSKALTIHVNPMPAAELSEITSSERLFQGLANRPGTGGMGLGNADGRVVDPDDEAGEVPMTFGMRQAGEASSEAEIAAHLGSRLASSKVPRSIGFVEADPKSASGKSLRRLLRGAVRQLSRDAARPIHGQPVDRSTGNSP